MLTLIWKLDTGHVLCNQHVQKHAYIQRSSYLKIVAIIPKNDGDNEDLKIHKNIIGTLLT